MPSEVCLDCKVSQSAQLTCNDMQCGQPSGIQRTFAWITQPCIGRRRNTQRGPSNLQVCSWFTAARSNTQTLALSVQQPLEPLTTMNKDMEQSGVLKLAHDLLNACEAPVQLRRTL